MFPIPVNSARLALGKRSSLAHIKPVLSEDGDLGGGGTQYTCFYMFIEFKLTPFPLKVQQIFPQMDFWSIKRWKKTREKEGLSFQVWQQGNSGMCCQGRPQDEPEERQRAQIYIYICSLIPTDRREAERSRGWKLHCYKKIYSPKNKNNSAWNINTNHISCS